MNDSETQAAPATQPEPQPAPAIVQALPPAQVAKAPAAPVIPWGPAGVEIHTMEDALRFARAVAGTDFAPKGMRDKPMDILIAVQCGAELGLSPMKALQSIAVVNGRPSLYGDAPLALCRSRGNLSHYSDKIEGQGETLRCTVTVKRRTQYGEEECTRSFSIADARRAKLLGKPGPWSDYPERMMMARARGFALRDLFGDILGGLPSFEEARDTPPAAPALPPLSGKPAETFDMEN